MWSMQDNSLKQTQEDSNEIKVIWDFIKKRIKLKLGENFKNKKRWHSEVINTHTQLRWICFYKNERKNMQFHTTEFQFHT